MSPLAALQPGSQPSASHGARRTVAKNPWAATWGGRPSSVRRAGMVVRGGETRLSRAFYRSTGTLNAATSAAIAGCDSLWQPALK